MFNKAYIPPFTFSINKTVRSTEFIFLTLNGLYTYNFLKSFFETAEETIVRILFLKTALSSCILVSHNEFLKSFLFCF